MSNFIGKKKNFEKNKKVLPFAFQKPDLNQYNVCFILFSLEIYHFYQLLTFILSTWLGTFQNNRQSYANLSFLKIKLIPEIVPFYASSFAILARKKNPLITFHKFMLLW